VRLGHDVDEGRRVDHERAVRRPAGGETLETLEVADVLALRGPA
jgi:hypothetical protein